MRSSVLLRPPPAWSARFAAALAAYGMLVGFAGSFTGLGGGFILVPFLLMLRLPLYQAVGTSFVAVLAISLTAVSKHAAYGMIVLDVGLALGIGGIVGSQVGARLVKRVSRRRFHRLFSVILLGLAAYLAIDAVLQGREDARQLETGTAQHMPDDTQARVGSPSENNSIDGDGGEPILIVPRGSSDVIAMNAGAWIALALVGLVVGVAAAFAGMGGGFLLVPILLVLGFGVVPAVATAFVAILMISVSALYAHIRQKGVLWRHGLVLAAAGVAGAYIGAALLHEVPAALFKGIFAALLTTFGARMAMEGWRPSRVREHERKKNSETNEFAPLPGEPALEQEGELDVPDRDDEEDLDDSVPINP